jgi:hypothetical protein
MKMISTMYLVLATVVNPVTASHIIDESENPQFLFVMSATAGSYEGQTLTITGVPSVTYFSDRPYRIAGHITLEKFVELWGEGSDSFKTDPPNATLSILGKNGNTDVIIELTNPLLIENGVSFKIIILEGAIPGSFNSTALFIDPFPTSVNSQITD